MQRPDGAVRGRAGATWVCAPGLAQLAICWYKTGAVDAADRAMAWLDRHQSSDGGFRGSYGPGAAYKADVSISWAAKFVLDAHLHRVAGFFARHAGDFPSRVSPHDGRLVAVLERTRVADRVLEVGCGKGRFLNALAQSGRGLKCCGVDPSPELLASVDESIECRRGGLERIPYPDASFDVMFAVESLEHSVVPFRGVAEMIRVAKAGGWIVIVDKHAGAWGRMTCAPWERWPDAAALAARLRVDCDDVSAEPVAYDDRPASDGLMMAWAARKRSRLTGEQWHDVLIDGGLEQRVVEDVRFGRLSEWGRTVLLETHHGHRVLEIGSGTGQISLQLAQAGRRAGCLDASRANLAFTTRCARQLHVALDTVAADATQPLPFVSRTFDCV
jgi:ubiquinone/menaquinone biosynthesis C-methylase UbiE